MCLSPPPLPIRIDVRAMVRIKFGLMDDEIWYKIDTGASFCHVNKIRPEDNGIPYVTLGTQKWKEESPSFMRAIVTMADGCCWIKDFCNCSLSRVY